MTFGSLFSGIGGLDLGLERAGFTPRWQVEIDAFARRVLAKHWPDVPKFGDIREIREGDLEPVDLIAGGFPCQPVSLAGRRRGRDDERWLWPEFARIVGLLRPRYVLVENVPGLLTAGMGEVLGDLSTLGYDAEWSVVSACSMGAPHPRERLFLVAYPEGGGWGASGGQEPTPRPMEFGGDDLSHGRPWSDQPRPFGVAHGIPRRVDRLRGLGNAVVPQVAEWVGRRILTQKEKAPSG